MKNEVNYFRSRWYYVQQHDHLYKIISDRKESGLKEETRKKIIGKLVNKDWFDYLEPCSYFDVFKDS